MGGGGTFYSLTVQLHLLWCGGEVQFPLLHFLLQSLDLTMQDSYPSLYSTKTLYHLYISDSC